MFCLLFAVGVVVDVVAIANLERGPFRFILAVF
jgi:hypothetical protein